MHVVAALCRQGHLIAELRRPFGMRLHRARTLPIINADSVGQPLSIEPGQPGLPALSARYGPGDRQRRAAPGFMVRPLFGWAEREGGIFGAQLIRATAVAVDVAATLGLCSRAAMRFFRPANASGFGATVGLATSDRRSSIIAREPPQTAGTTERPQVRLEVRF